MIILNNKGPKNRGFTLIELLAILVILGVITLVSVPNVIRSKQISQQRDLEEFKKTVENAAEVYVETHPEKYPTIKSPGQSTTVSIDELITAGFLNSNMTNPQTNNSIIESGGIVSVNNNNGSLTYTFNP